jgi:hypothetical protein
VLPTRRRALQLLPAAVGATAARAAVAGVGAPKATSVANVSVSRNAQR